MSGRCTVQGRVQVLNSVFIAEYHMCEVGDLATSIKMRHLDPLGNVQEVFHFGLRSVAFKPHNRRLNRHQPLLLMIETLHDLT